MANENGRWVTKFLVGALWTIVIGAIMATANNVICNDKESRTRDACEAEKRIEVNNEVVRIDTNQKEVIKKVDKILDNQETLIKVVTRLETKIEKIQ